MKRAMLLIAAFIAVSAVFAQLQHPWEQLYLEIGKNPDNAQNGYNFIEVAPDNTLYLLESEAVSGTFGGSWIVRLKRLDGTNWTQLGQDLSRNTENNEEFLGFLITPGGGIYLGMKDTILHFNAASQLWESFFVPGFYGGLSVDDNSDLYFIHRVNGPSGSAYSNLSIARFNNGTVTVLNSLGTDLPMVPRVVNGSNKIVFNGTEVVISVIAQSVNSLWVFRGDLTNGFQKLEPGAPQSTLYAGLGLSSMAVGSQGEILISRRAGTGTLLMIDQYDDASGTWLPFDTSGLHIGSGQISQLRYDRNGVLHLIYSGNNGTGFLFRYTGQGWEHIGPKNFWSHVNIYAAWKPWITFDTANVPVWSHGQGTSMNPYQIFRHETSIGIPQGTGDHLADVVVHPNPAVDYLQLQNLPVGASLQLMDLTGRPVYTTLASTSQTTIPTQNLMAGIYLVRIAHNNALTVRKVVVKRM